MHYAYHMHIFRFLILSVLYSSCAAESLHYKLVEDIGALPSESIDAINKNDYSFPYSRIEFMGATVFDQEQIASQCIVKNSSNTISIHGIYQVINCVNRIYSNAGYFLAQAILPPQKITSGKIVIKIYEGQIDEININTYSKYYKNYILNTIPEHHENFPISSDFLEKTSEELNKIIGLSTKIVIKSSESQIGKSNIIIDSKFKKFETLFSVDNSLQSKYGDLSFTIGSFVNGIFFNSKTGITIKFTNTPKNFHMYNFSHIQKIHDTNLSINIIAQSVATNNILNGLEISNFSRHGVLEFKYLVNVLKKCNAYLSMEIDYLDSVQNIMGGNSNDNIRSIRFSLDYTFKDSANTINTANIKLSQGIGIMGHTNMLSTNKSRESASGIYTKLNLSYVRHKDIYNKVKTILSFSSQYAFTPLLSPEEFIFGGQEYGRGYINAIAAGSSGAAIKIDIVFSASRKLFLPEMRYYILCDAGLIYSKHTHLNDNPLKFAPGIGATAFIGKNTIAKLEITRIMENWPIRTHSDRFNFLFTIRYLG